VGRGAPPGDQLIAASRSRSKTSAASACMPGRTCWYTLRVKPGLAWPRRSDTTLTGIPARSRGVAWVWRRSWERRRGRSCLATLSRTPKAANPAEKAFLGLGAGARMWLVEAGAAGASRVKVKMADAVELAALHGSQRVDWALGHATTYGRFGEHDLAS